MSRSRLPSKTVLAFMSTAVPTAAFVAAAVLVPLSALASNIEPGVSGVPVPLTPAQREALKALGRQQPVAAPAPARVAPGATPSAPAKPPARATPPRTGGKKEASSQPAPAALKDASPKDTTDISSLPDVSGSAAVSFPKFGCTMVETLPMAVAPHVRFKLAFGPGTVQQIEFDDPASWGEDAKPLVENVNRWSQDAEQYMGCLRTWRNQTVGALNQVIRYSNTVQELVENQRHAEIGLLESPVSAYGPPYRFECKLPEPVLGEVSEVEVAGFDSCVQRHVQAHERFIDRTRKTLADNTQRVIDRVKLAR